MLHADPVNVCLAKNLPYLENWVSDMHDALHLLDLLIDNVKDPGRSDGDHLLSLFRVAMRDLSGGMDELGIILSISEKRARPAVAIDLTPLTQPLTPLTPFLTPLIPPLTPLTLPLTPMTLLLSSEAL